MNYTKMLVKQLKEATKINSDNTHSYALMHLYDENPKRKVFVRAPYEPNTFCALLAYIEFQCGEFDQSYSMDQTEIVEVLEKFYGCEGSPKRVVGAQKVDLYYNWEAFCGSEVQAVDLFKRQGLEDMLEQYVLAWNAKLDAVKFK